MTAPVPSVSSDGPPRVARWVADVAGWNRKIDLSAARSEAELADLMVADAAFLAEQMPENASVVDVGTGAGAPGLPLAMLRPDLRVTLVEPMQKRVALLRMSIGKARLTNCRVEQKRGDAVSGSFDVAVSRATLPPPAWLSMGARLAPRGEVWVLLAQLEAPTLEGWRCDLDRSYPWPATGAERRALRYRPA